MKVQKLRGIITNYRFGILCEYNILISWPLTLCQSPLNSDILSSAMVFCEKEKGIVHEDLKNEYCRFCGQEAGPLLQTSAGSISIPRSRAIIPALNTPIEVVDLSSDTSIPIIPALTAPVQRFASFAANSKAVEAARQGSILKSKSMSDLKRAGMGKQKKVIAEARSIRVIVGEKGQSWDDFI